ncbi:MAG TPA: DNA-3-methyladenine glycosylase [Pyrinomonadaceae bacterium]
MKSQTPRSVRRAAGLVRLERDFYTRADTLRVARELLGKRLVVPSDAGARVSGRVVEVEAYLGVEDRAAHSFGGRRTRRTETMYAVGGTAYVFFVYGMHHQFNVVTGPAGRPHALLVRAVEPEEGIELMKARRPVSKERELTSGPGKLCRALALDLTHDGEDLTAGGRVWLEETGVEYGSDEVASGARIGVDYAGEDALRPWRFWVKGNVYVSRKG